jgi:hypothetical protein
MSDQRTGNQARYGGTDAAGDVMWPIVRQRAALSLLLRWGIRAYHLFSPYGLVALGEATGRGRLMVALTLAGAGIDLAISLWLRRSTRPLIAVRLIVDGADAVVMAMLYGWVAPLSPSSDAGGMSGAFVAEVAFRKGIGPGIVTGTWIAACVTAGRLAVSAPINYSELLVFSLGPALLGTTVFAYFHHQVRVAEQEALDRRQADVEAAHLQTRSDLQIGKSGSIVDRLQAAFFRMTISGSADSDALRKEAAAYKAGIAERVRARAYYLGDVLREEAAEARKNEPATSRHHFFDFSVLDGLLVVTARQASGLRDELRECLLIGRIQVSLVENDTSTRRFVLDVDGRLISSTPPERPRRIFLAPAGFGCAGLIILSMSNPAYQQVSLALSTAFAAALALLGWWSHTALARRGSAAGYAVALAANVPLCLVVLAQFLSQRQSLGGYRALLPMLPALSAWAFTIGPVWDVINRRRRLALCLLALALALLSNVLVIPRLDGVPAPNLLGLAAEGILPMAALIGTIRLGRACAETERRVTQRVNAGISQLVDRAVADAAAEEIAFLQERLCQARRLLTSLAAGPDRRAATVELQAAESGLAVLLSRNGGPDASDSRG